MPRNFWLIIYIKRNPSNFQRDRTQVGFILQYLQAATTFDT